MSNAGKVVCWFAMAVTVLVMGCVPSINSFFTPEAKVEMPGLNGTWQMMKSDGTPENQPAWKFEPERIITYGDKGGSGTLQVAYFKVGDQVFLDSTADSPAETSVSSWWSLHTMPIHYVWKVEQGTDTVTFVMLDDEGLDELIDHGSADISFTPLENDRLYTATPEQWMTLLAAHATNEDLFPSGNRTVFRRADAEIFQSLEK